MLPPRSPAVEGSTRPLLLPLSAALTDPPRAPEQDITPLTTDRLALLRSVDVVLSNVDLNNRLVAAAGTIPLPNLLLLDIRAFVPGFVYVFAELAVFVTAIVAHRGVVGLAVAVVALGWLLLTGILWVIWLVTRIFGLLIAWSLAVLDRLLGLVLALPRAAYRWVLRFESLSRMLHLGEAASTN